MRMYGLLGKGMFCAALSLTGLQQTNALVIGVDGGTGAPAATLGSYSMTPFGVDPSSLFSDVVSVASPLGGSVDFSIPMNLRQIGNGWATWSHGYTGQVYYANGADSVVLTLPTDTVAFYLYVEPNQFNLYDITAIANGGAATVGPVSVTGSSGANYFGFYTTAGDFLTSLTINVDPAAESFAIGEFGIAKSTDGTIAIPEPMTAGLGIMAMIGFALTASRRRR